MLSSVPSRFGAKAGPRDVASIRAALGLAAALLLVSLSPRPAPADVLTIAHTQFTDDWNVFASETRTSHFANLLVHEALYQEQCIGGESIQQSSFKAWCVRPAARVESNGSLYLNLNEDACRAGGRPLHANDIAFTVDRINRSQANPYQLNKLRVEHSRLWIGFPVPIGSWSGQNIMTFPLARTPTGQGAGEYHDRNIGPGDEAIVNAASAGLFRFERIRENDVVLKFRDGHSKKDVKVDEVRIKYFPRLTDLNDVLADRDRPDVVLSVPSIRVSRTLYETSFPPEANSVTYVGFNFNTRDNRARALFGDESFRKLFTQSLWATDPVRTAVDIKQTQTDAKGIFIGESLDVGDPRIVDTPSADDLSPQIQRYLKTKQDSGSLTGVLVLRVIIAPDIEYYFDPADRQNIERQLNALWAVKDKAGIQFRFVDPASGAAAFRTSKKENTFHLSMETLVYGSNRLRYMKFVDPKEPRHNELGIALFDAGELDEMMQTANQGRRRFLDKVRDVFPVAVIGHFPRRDLHSTNVVRPPTTCPQGSFVAPYADLQMWRRK